MPLSYQRLCGIAEGYHAGQSYGDDEPYKHHLEEVRAVLVRFGYSLKSHPVLHQAARMHDLFEDTPAKPEDLVDLGADPAAVQIALAVTDEPGANRKERKLKTYPKIAANPDAVIIKLSDRIANVERRGKIDMYREENASFAQHLRHVNPAAEPMWQHLDRLLA